ncbi:MAG: M36 family metallopeptidase [Saprospirales bacterium]|nr:M36 family metallopeptidase [Saprospirales bacterium]
MNQIPFQRLWWVIVAVLGLAFSLGAQPDMAPAKETALRFLQRNPAAFNLSGQDVADVRVTDAYQTRHNGISHVWVQQQHAGIPVHNALFGLHVRPDGSVLHLGHRFVPYIRQRVNTTLPSLGASKALELAAADLGLAVGLAPAPKVKTDARNWIFSAGAIARADIPVEICYEQAENGSLRLAWKIDLQPVRTPDYWTVCVDAQTGEILSRHNNTVFCNGGAGLQQHDACAAGLPGPNTFGTIRPPDPTPEGAATESYRVFALPVESPNHGSRSLLTDPADLLASPYGWLDIDGAPGAEFTYTRGNNVWAFDDSANDDFPSVEESADGGPGRTFDFPFNPSLEPLANLDASITNLFCANNMVHDIAYRFGFDEQAGNFQDNNYGRGGQDNDFVYAQAIDGEGQDDASFMTVSDGGPGIMHMYRWGQRGGIVKVNAPNAILGAYEGQPANTGGSSGWGAPVTATPVTGDVVVADDGSGSNDAHLGCTPSVNTVQGKIVIVDRGVCPFSQKALYAQQAGAIGCIICNYEDSYIQMLTGAYGSQVTIPVVMLTKSNCDILRQYAGNGLNISLVKPTASGPDFVDAGFDNGVILHEYTHGISNRLTGGPSNVYCLNNDEHMGEGWSDFMAMALTAQPGDTGDKPRGVATYVYRQDKNGGGQRRFPYSTDMSVNPLTFEDVAENPETHALGEVWAAVTWDLYWAMVEKYGFDADLNNLNSGNARAIQLVIDGMKLQPCRPGFIDGRNAILAADALNYNGADTCLISQVFARRGLGYFASQGSNTNPADGVENFDPIPTCVKALKIEKIVETPLIKGGEAAGFTLKITNHKDDAVTGVTVTDPLPAGWSLLSANHGGTLANGVVSWSLGALAPGQVVVLQYTAQSDAATYSTLYFTDDMEEPGGTWSSFSNISNVFQTFYLQSDDVKVGVNAWKTDNVGLETDQVLQHYLPLTVSGAQPTLRIWHKFNTEAGADAGFLEVQIAGESYWRRLAPERVFRKGYTAKIPYATLAIPFLSGFSGNSSGWVRSYFDLSEYAGKEILFQFRFGSNDNIFVQNGGWWIDQVQVIDMVHYDVEACVYSAQGDQACDRAPERGVIMDTEAAAVGVDVPGEQVAGIRIQPNPAGDVLALSFPADLQGPVQVLLVSAGGVVVARRPVGAVIAGQVLSFDVQHLPAGLYVLRVESSTGSWVEKVAIR